MTERPVSWNESADEKPTPVTRHEAERPAAPATRHESAGGAPATRHESVDGPPATRHEDAGGAPATRHEGEQQPVRSRRRLVFPPAVEEKYEYLRELSSGGAQADVVLFRDLADGTEVAIKIYRPDASKVLDRDAIEPLTEADEEHVLRFRLESDEYQIWEVQEYFPLGSLEDLVNRRGGGAQSPDFVLDVLREIGQALDHVHSLGVCHRDLKPQNILIRSEDPLDCVLADFGLARMGVLSNAIGSVAGTYIYTSPEGSIGKGNKANDWWGLGVIAHELLTGRHLHAIPGGDGVLSELRVRAAFMEQSWSYDDVTDPRWRLLLDGLLSPAEGRWAWTDVDEWLAGGSPAVTAMWPNRIPTSQRRARKAYHFAGTECTEPEQLARAIRENFMIARDHLAGVRVGDLRSWLHETWVGDGADEILDAARSGATSPGRAAVELQLLLDPDHEPSFRDRELSSAGIAAAITAAKKADAAAAEWTRELRGSSVLSVVGRHAEEPLLSRADELLTMWWRDIDAGSLAGGLWGLPDLREFTAPARQMLEGILLDSALNAEARGRIWSRARELLGKVPASERSRTEFLHALIPAGLKLESFPQAAFVSLVFPPWFERIAATKREAEVRAKAQLEEERAEARARAKAETARLKEEARRGVDARARQRRGSDWMAVWAGVIACATVLVPWLAGRYLLRGSWPRRDSPAVYDFDARRGGAYFLTDWVTGCLLVGVLVAAFILLRPWRRRVAMVVVAALGLGAMWHWGVAYVQREWNKQELVTADILRSTPYPFDSKYYTCGSASMTAERRNADGHDETTAYSLFTARTKGSTSQACDRVEFWEGWHRVRTFTLRAPQYVDSNAFSGAVNVTQNTTVAKTVFTVQTRSGKVTYKLPALLARG
ncbi:protein kinase [Kribbella sp. NPDC051137]|uniref:protein kinase domain-containing protein n=1 Tax=Kribbella sp. NPDC051137 TaxID=3155045 RepID=UPI002F63D87A